MRSLVVTHFCRFSGVAAVLLVGSITHANEFILKNGGVVDGVLRPEPSNGMTYYTIELDRGGKLKLDRAQVARIEHDAPALREYERHAAAQTATVESQWALAEWCRKAGLKQQRAVHLEQVLQLDPNHANARRALGYSQIKGEWIRPADYQQREGYVRYKGKWRTSQEIQLIKEREARQAAEREWWKQLTLWRNQLLSERPHEVEAARALRIDQ